MRKRIVVLGILLMMVALFVVPVGSVQAVGPGNFTGHGNGVSHCVHDVIAWCQSHVPHGLLGVCTGTGINAACFGRGNSTFY